MESTQRCFLYQPVTSKQVLHKKQVRTSESRFSYATEQSPGAESDFFTANGKQHQEF